jgi:hypothetical protein
MVHVRALDCIGIDSLTAIMGKSEGPAMGGFQTAAITLCGATLQYEHSFMAPCMEQHFLTYA